MQQNESQSNHKQIFKEWLEKLQQESWQLELLISGFAIYGIYASKDFINQLDYYTDNNLSGELGLFGFIIVFILQKGWIIFFLNLLIHVILRGLWIGAIGLRYVSGEIDYKTLGYSERFASYLKKKLGSYDDFIESLEKICSVIFAYTFLLFLLLASMMLFMLEVMFLVYIIQKIPFKSLEILALFSLIWMGYFMIGLLVLIDFLTLGIFKKIKDGVISRIYFPIYRFYSYTTLSFLYRPLLYNFIDNKYTRRLFYFSIPYILIIVLGEGMFENNNNIYFPSVKYQVETASGINPEFYDDLRKKDLDFTKNDNFRLKNEKLNTITLEMFEITKNITSFFISIDKDLEKEIESSQKLSAFRKRGLSLALFQNKSKDPYINQLNEEKSAELKPLYEKRRIANRDFRKSNDPIRKNIADSLSAIIDLKEKEWKNKEDDIKKSASQKILNTYLSYFTFSIDEEIVELQNCYFTRHPDNNEQGIRCFIKLDSLDKGIHTFKFVRKSDSPKDQNEKILYLPIIKH